VGFELRAAPLNTLEDNPKGKEEERCRFVLTT
jgi:hypothetical protein